MNFYLIATGLMLFLQMVLMPTDSLSVSSPIAASSLKPTRVINESVGVAITAPSALIIDSESRAVLWQKNADQIRPIASITKLATVLTFLNYSNDLDQLVEIMPSDYTSLGFNTFRTGDRVVLKDVIAAVIIASDNTAANALARHSGFTRDSFIGAMNQMAADLGLSRTVFVDPSGLSEKNISTAREILVLAESAFGNPVIAQYSGQANFNSRTISGRNFSISNTNKLIGGMINIVASKTGFVTESGYNLVAEAVDSDRFVLGVVLGSQSLEDRFQDYKMMSYWAWQNYQWPE
jgi:serine-type D-Ala-D-Ala endopeptidase (penicillin-binding protein 7)